MFPHSERCFTRDSGDPENLYLLSEMSGSIRYINSLLLSCDSILMQVKTNMNITDEDFEIFKDGRYKVFQMLDDVFMSF